jgi:hypothetical protein
MDKRFPGSAKHIARLKKDGVILEAPVFFSTIPLVIAVAVGWLSRGWLSGSIERLTRQCWGGGEETLSVCLRAFVISGWPEWVGLVGIISFFSAVIAWWLKRPSVQLNRMGVNLSRLGIGGWFQKMQRSPLLFFGYSAAFFSGLIMLWWVAQGDFFLGLVPNSTAAVSALVGRTVTGLVVWLICISGFSGSHGWYSLRKKTMMSDQEVRQEYKDDSGDPHVRGERKSLHQAILREELVRAVRRSAVVVVAPMSQGGHK